MTGMRHCSHEIVELYFYDELAPAECADVESHLRACAACRESLAELRAIQAALASRGRGAEPEDGWDAFMSRLEARLDRDGRKWAGARAAQGGGAALKGPPSRLMQLAAALALVATGVLAGWTLSRVTPAAPPASVSAPPRTDRVLTEASDTGLERARVVLAGLAQKDEGAEWSLERRMAATLLPEVRLIRQAAADRGRGDLADILMDVETLLLQASYARDDDPETLERLRGMIDRRDVLMRLSMAGGL